MLRKLPNAGIIAKNYWRTYAPPAARAVERQALALGLRPLPAPGSTLLIGYFRGNLGLGESVRNLASALAEVGEDFAIEPFDHGLDGRLGIRFMEERIRTARSHEVNLIEVSVGELARVFEKITAFRFSASYNILRTYWELPKAPAHWRAALRGIDEIWAPNRFVAAAFAEIFDGPVVIVPPAVDVRALAQRSDTSALPRTGRYRFLFSFDPHSFPARKNPLGVVSAFVQAFPPERDDVELVVKSSAPSAASHGEAQAELDERAARDPRIVVMRRDLPRGEMLGLIADCDCYVSLHRAEGFGMGMAEALALEKPVIATAFSGSEDFISHDTAFPVRFELRTVRPDEYVFADGQTWAEPDVPHCAELMRSVVRDRAAADRRARAGRHHVETRYALANVGKIAGERLRRIREARANGGKVHPVLPLRAGEG